LGPILPLFHCGRKTRGSERNIARNLTFSKPPEDNAVQKEDNSKEKKTSKKINQMNPESEI